MATLGLTSVGATTSGFFPENYLAAVGPLVATEHGTITAVSIYTGDSLEITLGVYNSVAGVPTTQVGQSTGGTSTLDGWTTQAVSGALVSGGTYWIVYNTSSGGFGGSTFKYDAGSRRIKWRDDTTYVGGSLNDPFGTESAEVTGRDYSAYITYAPVSVSATTGFPKWRVVKR